MTSDAQRHPGQALPRRAGVPRGFPPELQHAERSRFQAGAAEGRPEPRSSARATPCLVFTQYTDTMDYLRDQLRDVYGEQVACYCGRGGEIWNGIAWVADHQGRGQERLPRGRRSRSCSAPKSASEGLNLQTCGVLINYDMPWNPMRVEQRIGRIDRIGQEYDWVWISNYFYQDTVEERSLPGAGGSHPLVRGCGGRLCSRSWPRWARSPASWPCCRRPIGKPSLKWKSLL